MSNPVHFTHHTINPHPLAKTESKEHNDTQHKENYEHNSHIREANHANNTVTDSNNHGHNGQSGNDDNNDGETKSSEVLYFTNTNEEITSRRSSQYFSIIDDEIKPSIVSINSQEIDLHEDIHQVMNGHALDNIHSLNDVHHEIKSFFIYDKNNKEEIAELMLKLANIDKNSNQDEIDGLATSFIENINDKHKSKILLNTIFQLTKLCVDNINTHPNRQEKCITLFTNISFICNYALKHKCYGIDNEIKAIVNIQLESYCATLTLQALHVNTTETSENKKAKNQLFLLQFILEKIRKGLATPRQLMEYAELAEKSILGPAVITEGFGESLEVTINAETKGLHMDGSIIGTPIMLLHQIYFSERPIKLLDPEHYLDLLTTRRSHIAKFLSHHDKYHESNLREIHKKIKLIFKELNKETTDKEDLKARYEKCLKDIEEGIANGSIEPEMLTQITGKVKIRSNTFRGTLPTLLEILSNTFAPIQQQVNQNVGSMENHQEITNKIINQCYKLEHTSPYTSMEIAKCIKDAYKHTDWESKIAASSTIHRILHIINQSSCNETEKQLHKEIFLNKISTIDGLKRQRSRISSLVVIAGALGITSAFGASLVSQDTATSLTFDTFNTASTFTGLTLIGHTPHEFRGTSTNERSITEIILRDKAKQNNNQPLILKFINEYLDNNNHTVIQLDAKIDTFIKTNIPDSDDEFKKYIKASIFEFNIKHSSCKEKHRVQPFIFVLIEQTNNEEQQKLLLETYYQCTLYQNNSTHDITHNEAKFNKLLTNKHLNLNEGMLKFCQMLAIIGHTSNINAEIATNMSKTLTIALIHAKKDKLSNWHILVRKELKVNILIKFAITAASFALWLAAVAFLTPIVTPVGIVFIGIGLRLVRIWLHRKCEIHDKSILEQTIRHAERMQMQMQTHHDLNKGIRDSIDVYYLENNDSTYRSINKDDLDNNIRESLTKYTPSENSLDYSDEYTDSYYSIHNISESNRTNHEVDDERKSDISLDNHVNNLAPVLTPSIHTYQQRYQQHCLEKIIHKNTHNPINHGTELNIHARNQLIKELITFWIDQTHDSASLINTLEIIVEAINDSSSLIPEDKEKIKVALKLALKSSSLKKIIEHRQSNVFLDILIATILSTSDWASPLATDPLSTYLVSMGTAFIRVIILECNMNKLFTTLGLESNNQRECNRLIDQINVPPILITP